MHGGLAQRNSAGAASLQLRPLHPVGEDISCFIDGGDIFVDGRSFPSSEEYISGPDFSPAVLPSQAKSENFEAGEQSAVTMSNITSASGEASVSSGTRGDGEGSAIQQQPGSATATPTNNAGQAPSVKRKRNLPGTPDPDAEVIALSPKTLMATNRFVCEICNKGFQRDQNLQLHRRGHNLPWKLRQRTSKEIRKRVYICPETSCVHHDPARALGDLTGIKKHFCRKHGEKKWKCDKCSKKYAVQSDWKAHSKTCGTREYRCDCGVLFSRRDSFITHRAFCDALAEESARVSVAIIGGGQLPDNHGNALSTVQVGDPMDMLMGAPSSAMDTLSSASLRPGLPGNASRLGITENGLSLVPPRWEHTNASGIGTPVSRQRVSLWLGTGPGPGPPSNEQHIGAQGLQAGGLTSLNQLDTSSPIFGHSSKNVQGVAGLAGILGLSDYEGQKPLAGLTPLDSSSSGNHFGNIFAASGPLPGMGGLNSVGAMSGVSDFGGLTAWPDCNSTSGRLSLTASAGLASGSMSGNGGGLASVATHYNQSHAPSAQMSATALLQKAAQMGATASNSSLLRGFGMAGADANSSSMGSSWPGSGQDQGRGGMPAMVSNLVHSQPFMKGPSVDLSSISQGLGSSLSSSPLDGNTKGNENSSIHELMNSFSGSAGLFGGVSNIHSSIAPSLGDSGNIGGMLLQGNRQLDHRSTSKDSTGQLFKQRGDLQPPLMGASMLSGLGSLSRAEEGPDDRLTRDFLGVGRASGMVGSAGAIGRTFSQRGLASIAASIGSAIDVGQFSNQRDNLRSVGMRCQSPGKAWDAR